MSALRHVARDRQEAPLGVALCPSLNDVGVNEPHAGTRGDHAALHVAAKLAEERSGDVGVVLPSEAVIRAGEGFVERVEMGEQEEPSHLCAAFAGTRIGMRAERSGVNFANGRGA